MISAKTTLTKLGFTIESTSRIVQEVREIIELSPTPLVRASKLIKDVIEEDITFTDIKEAIIVAQYVVMTLAQHDEYDQELALHEGLKKVEQMKLDQPFAWVRPETQTSKGETSESVGEGLSAVTIKADGKIKKGGKQLLAAELYKKHVTDSDTPVENAEFIQILVSKLGMSKPGATTYASNCRKAANV